VVARGLDGASAIYGIKNGCLEIFHEAKRRGMLCILEQDSLAEPFEARLLAEEAERWPGWEPRVRLEEVAAAADPVVEREAAEWSRADVIVCPSRFAVDSLGSLGIDPGKCRVIPYGIDTDAFCPESRRSPDGKLNVLFAGIVGLRKGVPYLLEALRLLDSKRVNCRVVGPIHLDRGRLDKFSRWVEMLGPLPRSEIVRMYHWADVLAFPTICDSFGVVAAEAFACGVPVISTLNSGAIVRDGKDGFVVPIRDPDAIAGRLNRLLQDRELLTEMSRNALERSREFDLPHYAKRVLGLFENAAPPAERSACAD
jgi:glycosyltransferase involved in cell wall biosynthesis